MLTEPVRTPVRIPADIDLPDRVVGPFTARQLAVLGTTASVLYLAGNTVHHLAPVVPVVAILVVCAPVLGVVGLLVCGQRDGLSVDRLLWAALRHHGGGTRRITAPEGIPSAPAWLTTAATTGGAGIDRPPTGSPRGWQPPARSVTAHGNARVGNPGLTPPPGAQRREGEPSSGSGLDGSLGGGLGVVDLGADGLCVIAAASTVNFALRTPTEQDALVAGFGRYLHSLTAPIQILIRAERIDLTAQVRDLRARAATLPDRGLAQLAHDHAAFLARLHADADLLRHQVLLVWRDPGATTSHPTGPTTPGTSGMTELTDPETDVSAAPTGPYRRRRQGRRGTRAAAGAAARRAAQDRLARRVTEAADLLAPIGITVTGLDATRASAVLTAALNPGLPIAPSAATALPAEIITAGPRQTFTTTPNTADRFDSQRNPDDLDDEAIEAVNLGASPGATARAPQHVHVGTGSHGRRARR